MNAESTVERILIIDDDTALCELLIERLQDDEFVTEAVHDGVRGLERARSQASMVWWFSISCCQA